MAGVKRSPLRRRTPLARTGNIQRTAGLARVSKRRRTHDRHLAAVTPALYVRARAQCELSNIEVPACRGKLHRHHKLRRSQGGTHELANLLLVCELHHRYIHDHPDMAYPAGWMIRSGE